MNYESLLEQHFQEFLKLNFEYELDIEDKSQIKIDVSSFLAYQNGENIILETNIIQKSNKIGILKLILNARNEVIDEFFIIN